MRSPDLDEECARVRSGDPGEAQQALIVTCQRMSVRHINTQSTHLQIQLQEPDIVMLHCKTCIDIYLSLCQIQSRCQQDSVMTNHVLGPKTNSVSFAFYIFFGGNTY